MDEAAILTSAPSLPLAATRRQATRCDPWAVGASAGRAERENEVKDSYGGYERLLLEAKTQCKSNMDAIENTIKQANGHMSEQQLKLLKGSRQTIQGFTKALESQGEVLRTQMMDRRSGWDTACADVVFDTSRWSRSRASARS